MQGNRRTTTKKSGGCKFHVPKWVWITIFNLRFEAVIFLYLFKKKNIWDNKLLKSGVATTTKTYQLLLTKVHVKAFGGASYKRTKKSSSIFPSTRRWQFRWCPPGPLRRYNCQQPAIEARPGEKVKKTCRDLPTSIHGFQVAKSTCEKTSGVCVYLISIMYHV